MQIINFRKKDEAAIIEADGIDYIRKGEDAPIPVYKHMATGNIINPTDVFICDFIADEDVRVDPNDSIQDANGRIYSSIVGPRPRNIVRR